MRNYKGIFYRTDEISHEPNQCPDWLDLFATKLVVEERVRIASAKTAVEVSRERNSGPSIYEMMSSIVSGQKPKYSSVEEAVKDYQKQTGLDEYLKRAGDNDLTSIASQIIAAGAHGSCSKCGCSHEECECDNSDADDESDEDESDEDEEDEDEDDARDMNEMDGFPGKKLITEGDVGEKPELLKQNPAIESFLKNVIDTNIGIQVPAILHSLIETFGRDGVDYTVFSDEDLLQWINEQLINKGISSNEIPSHLGRGVGTHIDYTGDKDPNKDPFTLLVPDKGY